MKYRDIIGYSVKKEKKKIIPIQSEPSVVDNIKEEFGYVNEGPAYEYSSFVKNIEKAENKQAKEVNNLVKLLGKKGLKREATDLASKYMRGMRDFKDFMTKMMRKLI